MISVTRHWPFSAGSATAFGSALARCYGSGLLSLRLHLAHKPAVSFWTSPAARKFSAPLPWAGDLPGATAPFVPPFGSISLGGLFRTAGVVRPCWCGQ